MLSFCQNVPKAILHIDISIFKNQVVVVFVTASIFAVSRSPMSPSLSRFSLLSKAPLRWCPTPWINKNTSHLLHMQSTTTRSQMQERLFVERAH